MEREIIILKPPAHHPHNILVVYWANQQHKRNTILTFSNYKIGQKVDDSEVPKIDVHADALFQDSEKYNV